MTDINVANLFEVSRNQINKIKKRSCKSHKNLKGKVAVNATIKKLCDEILQLSRAVNNLMTKRKT